MLRSLVGSEMCIRDSTGVVHRHTMELAGPSHSVRFQPGQTTMAIPTTNFASEVWAGTIQLFELGDGSPSPLFTVPTETGVTGLVWSGNESAKQLLVSSHDDGRIRVWHGEQPVSELKSNQHTVLCLEAKPGSSTVVYSGGSNKSVTAWDIDAGKEVPGSTIWHSGQVQAIAAAGPDNLLSGTSDGEVVLWDLRSVQPAASNTTIEQGKCSISSLSWLNSYEFAVGCDSKDVLVFDTRQNNQPAKRFTGHTRSVTSVMAQGDVSSLLASTGSDNQVIVFDASTTEVVARFDKHVQPAQSVAWDPSCPNRLVSVGYDAMLHVHTLE
eukprot:TRINITY_DN14370_c0_g1_i1.p1 TRINITY_DN14370_c0_g1~~TRINITY_DN14370_c0_g1_i1.p1  ORF type:complete len:325 (-),score=95.26 TRINITY_DN14370_c0_g1_i1:200-1174(-)